MGWFSWVVISVALFFAAPADAQMVNGHPATATERQWLARYGVTSGSWHLTGWGFTLVEPAVEKPTCHYVLDVPLDCAVVVAAK